MEQWIPLLGEYGFPAAVTFYLLHRVEKKLDRINESILRQQHTLPEPVPRLEKQR
ncbi:YvrJ family protein [Alkalicoccus urumqiensis]|uniref:YvrJ family protein n=1 Tax=Alkalicoccus urumqiensis TaxID=1548213 RepID=A0A2P6MDY6_ALKUR|nr:YvrJ family protein [Alkalicoccus urumqiensis]PRO64485.1 YvrJ family protein [Alkalicoccus urumqiensis]